MNGCKTGLSAYVIGIKAADTEAVEVPGFQEYRAFSDFVTSMRAETGQRGS